MRTHCLSSALPAPRSHTTSMGQPMLLQGRCGTAEDLGLAATCVARRGTCEFHTCTLPSQTSNPSPTCPQSAHAGIVCQCLARQLQQPPMTHMSTKSTLSVDSSMSWHTRAAASGKPAAICSMCTCVEWISANADKNSVVYHTACGMVTPMGHLQLQPCQGVPCHMALCLCLQQR